MSFLVIFIILVISFLTVTRIFPLILSWIIKKTLKISINIGRIGLPYVKLCDITLQKDDIIISIKKISLKSSFLNSELTKLVTLIVEEVRINDYSHFKNPEKQILKTKSKNVLDFRDKKVPHYINSFAQFMAVHIYNISYSMLLEVEPIQTTLSTTVKELHLDGSISKRSLLVTLNVMDARTEIIDNGPKINTKIADFAFGIALEATLVAQGPLAVEKLDVRMSESVAILTGRFFTLIKNKRIKKEELESLKKVENTFSDALALKNKSFWSHFTNKTKAAENVLQNNEDILDRFFPIIPKNCILQIDDTTFECYNERGKSEFISSLKLLSLNYRTLHQNEKSGILLNFNLTEFLLENDDEKAVDLKVLNIDAKLKNNILNIYMQQSSFLLTYNHTVMHKWFDVNISTQNNESLYSKIDLISTPNQNTVPRKHRSMFEDVAKNISVNFCAEVTNVMAVIKLKGDNWSSMGFSKLRLMLDQAQESRGSNYNSYFANLLLNDRHWQTELLLESLWWSFKEWNHDPSVAKVMHVWGTPIYLGMGLVKFCTSENSGNKLYCLLETLQLEWSMELSEFAILAVKCLMEYQFKIKKKTSKKSKLFSMSKLETQMIISHFNCFLQSQKDEYFVSRLDTISVNTADQITNFKFEEFKLFTLKNTGDYYTCIRTEDILNYKVFVKIAQVNYSRELRRRNFCILLEKDVVVFWSMNFHLKALFLVREINDFKSSFLNHFPKNETEKNLTGGTKKDSIIDVTCNVYGKFEFHIDISKNHNAKLHLGEASFFRRLSKSKPDTNCSVRSLSIAIDNVDTFEIKGISWRKLRRDEPDAQPLLNERIEAGICDFHENNFIVFIDLFKIIFPYEHKWAEAVQNQLMSVIKWLRLTHKKKKTGQTHQPEKLSADFYINVKEYLFEMSDDPFEVKLRDNFELLLDEFNESIKRQKMLKEKISELQKTNIHMPAGKMEELYATLKKKNADIYIQRSKLMYQAVPQRTRLFAWSMTNVEIMVMNDWSLHHTKYEKLTQMDPDSIFPPPEEFNNMWLKHVSLRCVEWKFELRDFPQPLLDIRKIYFCGMLGGANQIAPKRATRTVTIDLGEPFGTFEIEREMSPLKYYYDLNCEMESYSYAFGPCWDPIIAQCNLSFNQISAPSRDPSPPMPWWDKVRLLFHGRLTMMVQKMQVLLHASLDPYNTTEEMALTWEKVVMDWTNAKLVFKGDLNIFVRTASKYDDVQLLKLPNLKLILAFHWVCLADPNDHHNVIYCAPDKIPEYSSNQVHDSFRAFRSQNLNLSIVLETKQSPGPPSANSPILLLYGSTLRWIESLKLILSGRVTRPTRRGKVFNNVRPRKPQISRHYKKVNLLIGLHKFQVCYWMSFAMHRGCELLGGRLSSASEHTLSIVPIDDGLIHRPRADWSIVYMNSELSDSEIWLKSAIQEESEIETPRIQPVEKYYCLSVAKVSYGRETVLPNQSLSERNKDTPTHRLVVYDLKGAWTKNNRNVAFALFDSFMKNQRMKKNLSTEALKGFRKDPNTTPLKKRNDSISTPTNSAIQAIQASSTCQDTPSPISKLQSGHAANMLQQLIAEADNNAIVYSDDLSAVSRQQRLQGVQACQEDDVLHKNWQIALVNAQVLLKGCETNGYVILSAAKAEIVQRIHRPIWKDRTLVSKTTWTGLLECMQYYATVNLGANDSPIENNDIMWLTLDNIQEKESTQILEPTEVPNMVGTGVSVGAVVMDPVGPTGTHQLQRIVSRCKCEFFYADYGDISVDPEGIGEIPPPPQEDVVSLWDSRHSAVDAFTLMHHDLEVCTNSLQYEMLLDITNNLLLYVEPHRKEALEKLARMRFKLQLHSVEDQRKPIQEKQTMVRNTINRLRRLEKDTYLVNKALEENPEDMERRLELDRLERLMLECKNQLNIIGEELDMMLSCYKETQLLANARMATTRSDKPLVIVRANEICFKHARWRLTEADGQIGIADLVLSNFLYTKNSKSDDSVEHLLELGYLRMTNLLPNEIYKEIICPTEIQYDMPIEHKKVLRIFCREKSPVGGISVKEHFEINLVPLTIGLTKKFYNTMMKFCFPERDPDTSDFNDGASQDGDVDTASVSSAAPSRKKSKSKKSPSFYVHIDDVEKMKERAEKNKLFVYIKIPEVPVKVSYKGTKEKNLEDLRDVSIVIPTLEYHNMTWTWLDLLIAIRNDTKRVILSQAIKQKLQIKRHTGTGEDNSAPQEEDKAKMLLGSRHAPENKSVRKGVFSFGK